MCLSAQGDFHWWDSRLFRLATSPKWAAKWKLRSLKLDGSHGLNICVADWCGADWTFV